MGTTIQPAVKSARPHRTQLRAAYAICRAIARTAAKNFYYGFLVLPRHKRNALSAVYAFMRHADDISDDDTPGLSIAQKRQRLSDWQDALHRALAGQPTDEPVLLAVADTQRRYNIPLDLLDQLVVGTAMDLNEEFPPVQVPRPLNAPPPFVMHRTFDDLYRYCYHVASVVGLVTIRIFGYNAPGARSRHRHQPVNPACHPERGRDPRDLSGAGDPSRGISAFENHTGAPPFPAGQGGSRFEGDRGAPPFPAGQGGSRFEGDRGAPPFPAGQGGSRFEGDRGAPPFPAGEGGNKHTPEHLAEQTGVAFQLTNILRDVKEDALRGRIYFPADDLAVHALTAADFIDVHDPARLRPLLAEYAERARELYKSADRLLPMIDEDSRPALWALVEIYRRLLERIIATKFEVFGEKIRVPTHEKIGVLTRGLLRRLK